MKRVVSVFLALCFTGGVLAWAQEASEQKAGEFKLPHRETLRTPDDIVRQFEAPEVTSYVLDDGDELTIEIWGRTELSGKHVIGPDGKISLPLTGPIALAGLTREDAERAVTKAYSAYYSNLAAVVRVDKYNSFRVMVLGRVGVPGPLAFDHQPTLLDVLTKSAVLPVGGLGTDKSNLVRCAIFRGRDQIVWIDLKPLINQGHTELNIRLARNDTVYLPDGNDQLVYVLGEVKSPGAQRLTPSMTFLTLVALAGGPTVDAAQTHIVLIRPSTNQQEEIGLQTLLKQGQKSNYSLEEGDIVYVPSRKLANFGYVLQKVSAITGFAILATVAK